MKLLQAVTFGTVKCCVHSITFQVWNERILLSHPCAKSMKTLGDGAFIVAAPKMWNALPEAIRDATSIQPLNKKKHIFLLYTLLHFSI